MQAGFPPVDSYPVCPAQNAMDNRSGNYGRSGLSATCELLTLAAANEYHSTGGQAEEYANQPWLGDVG